MNGDFRILLTPRFVQQLLELNGTHNNAGPFVLAVAVDEAEQLERCELQSASRLIVNARFERPLGATDWTDVPASPGINREAFES